MIVAIISGPIIAVQLQKLIERLIQRKQAKEAIFKTLMSTRGTPISLPHVQALNMIDLEFYGEKKKDKKVVDAWKLYRDHLYDRIDPKDPNRDVKTDAWLKKSSELLTDLLFEMSISLNYNFDKVLLKRGAYTPQGYGDTESAQLYLRDSLVGLFAGKTALPIRIVEKTTGEKTQNPQSKNEKR
jgi:hypothetical protein